MNSLLKRQLKKVGLEDGATPPDAQTWTLFLERVNRAYDEAEQDRYLLERSLSISSREMQEVNERLEGTVEELGRVKRRVEAILNSVGEAILVIKPDGRIQQVNGAFEDQTGYSSSEVLLQFHHQLLLDHTMPGDVFKESTSAMRAGSAWRGEMPVRRKNGSIFDAAVTITPLFETSRDEVSAFVGVLRDITEMKELERMKDAFVSNVSHELRTPITSLKLLLAMLKTTPVTEQAGTLSTLIRETDRLNVIIEDLLRLSRLDQEAVELNLKEVNVNLLAGQYVTDRTPLAEERDLTLSFDEQHDLPSVQADEGLLGQTLSILLTNAINYTPSGGRVSVGTHLQSHSGSRWVGISITDTGIGIASDEQPHLFERFYRGKVGQESGAPGTGLGLAIAKEIVSRHNGRIEVDSEGVPGQGTTFRIWLPLPE